MSRTFPQIVNNQVPGQTLGNGWYDTRQVMHCGPRVPKTVEEHILTKLTEKLSSIVNVFKPAKKASTEHISEKARVRSQLQIGTSGVFRALERDTLACILVSGQATPAITVDHIISLAREQGCPLLCLDQLAPAIARATDSKCLPLAIGFRKMEDSSNSDFAEIVSLVKENVTVQASQNKHVSLSTGQLGANRKNVETNKISKYIPVKVNTDAEKEILEELKRTFSEALIVRTDQEKNVKIKKKQKKKRNLKDAFDKAYHSQFDIGKRTVTGILERGKLQLILISEEILPILLSETQPCTLLSIAAVMKCPVVILPGLMNTMRELCGGNVSVLGLKKISCLQDAQRSFEQLLDKCLQAVNSITKECLPQSRLEEMAQQISPKMKMETDDTNAEHCLSQDLEEASCDVDIDQTSTKTSQKNARTNNDNESVKEDYSYLYIKKKDSKELVEVKRELQVVAESSEKDHFSGDFISLTSSSDELKFPVSSSSRKQKVKTAGTDNKSTSSSSKTPQTSYSDSVTEHSVGKESSTQNTHNFIPFTELDTSDGPNPSPGTGNLKIDALSNRTSSKEEPQGLPLFSICRSGYPVSHTGKSVSKSFPERNLQEKGQTSAYNEKSKYTLGMKELPGSEDSKVKGIDYLSLGEDHKNAKKATKRKLQNDDTFISFAYTESNIRTMTSDPSKKKKKRKKK